MNSEKKTVRLKVSTEVARIVGPKAPRELQLTAARGALPFNGKDLVTSLFFLAHGKDREIRQQALKTFQELPVSLLKPVAMEAQLHPQLLDFMARYRIEELPLMELVLTHIEVSDATLIHVAGKAAGSVLSLVANNDERLIQAPDIIDAIFANPEADKAIKFRLGWKDPEVASEEAADEGKKEDYGEIEELSEGAKSKYQLALEFGVSDKIKAALTGDKEWRNLLLKDANKLVCSAVIKNPRITEGEVLMVAKNKSANEELIRLINLNREWVKNYEIRRALVMNPRTPLPRAIRYMNTMTDKDIRDLAKSRNVSQVLVNTARRMIMAKEQKK